jgi:hypothetical protein
MLSIHTPDPDKNPGNPEAKERFQHISEAYRRVTDPDYDDDTELTEEQMFDMAREMFESSIEQTMGMFDKWSDNYGVAKMPDFLKDQIKEEMKGDMNAMMEQFQGIMKDPEKLAEMEKLMDEEGGEEQLMSMMGMGGMPPGMGGGMASSMPPGMGGGMDSSMPPGMGEMDAGMLEMMAMGGGMPGMNMASMMGGMGGMPAGMMGMLPPGFDLGDDDDLDGLPPGMDEEMMLQMLAGGMDESLMMQAMGRNGVGGKGVRGKGVRGKGVRGEGVRGKGVRGEGVGRGVGQSTRKGRNQPDRHKTTTSGVHQSDGAKKITRAERADLDLQEGMRVVVQKKNQGASNDHVIPGNNHIIFFVFRNNSLPWQRALCKGRLVS